MFASIITFWLIIASSLYCMQCNTREGDIEEEHESKAKRICCAFSSVLNVSRRSCLVFQVTVNPSQQRFPVGVCCNLCWLRCQPKLSAKQLSAGENRSSRFFGIDRTWRQVRSFIEIYDNFLLGSDAASAKLLRSAFPADNPIGIKVRNHN